MLLLFRYTKNKMKKQTIVNDDDGDDGVETACCIQDNSPPAACMHDVKLDPSDEDIVTGAGAFETPSMTEQIEKSPLRKKNVIKLKPKSNTSDSEM